MQKEQREEARRLRREEGLSVKEICTKLGVAKSSVSVWVRDIELTEEQKADLLKRYSPTYRGRHEGSRAVAAKYREIRRTYQDEGRTKATENDPLHIAGCMLYWAEGAKSRNALKLANSDPALLQFYVRFLRQSLLAENSQFVIRVFCYTNNGLSVNEIENYWLNLFGLPRTCLGKTAVNNQPSSSQQKGRKLLYGTCEISINSTRLVHHVFGAIQEYSGIDKPEWLM